MQNILFAMRILQRFICEHLDHHYENIRRKITGKYYYTAGILHSKRSSFFSLSISLSPLAQPRKQIIFISQQNARVAIPSHFFVPWITRWKGGANGVLEIVYKSAAVFGLELPQEMGRGGKIAISNVSKYV